MTDLVTLEEAAPDGSFAWLKSRKKGLGGSDAAALLGVHPWMSLFALYSDKTTDTKEQEYGAVLEIGHELEPMTRRRFMADTGWNVEPSAHTHVPKAYPWMRGNIDGNLSRPDRDGLGVFEGKTTNPYNRHDWEREGAPLYYLVQVTHYMICTGRDHAAIAVLVLGNREPLLWEEFNLDTEFAEQLIELERNFWHDHVLAGVPPEIDSHPATTRMIKDLHPDDNGVTIDLPEAAILWAEKLEDASAHRKEVDDEITGLKNKLRHEIGSATLGMMEDGSGFQLATSERKESITKASKSRTLRRVKAGKNMAKAKARADKKLRETTR